MGILALVIATALAGSTGRDNPFLPLDSEWPTPNRVRTAAGRPGVDYWQQRANHRIEVTLDDKKQRLTGSETIVYENHSPDALPYLWLHLDNNQLKPDAHAVLAAPARGMEELSYDELSAMLYRDQFQGGLDLSKVADGEGNPLRYTIRDTVMRVDLPQPLQPGERTTLAIDWSYSMQDHSKLWARTGWEYFEDDGNYLYEVAHWFPRMVAYTDQGGWQHEHFLGRGEFTLEFGDYELFITVPDDHVVAATGELMNPEEVLNEAERARLEEARTAKAPVYVVTPKEATKNLKSKPKSTKTWHFKADNVRDVAFASSRRFIWDAWGVPQDDGRTVLAMSFYPPEAEPLWSMYSTQAVAHTLEVYGEFAFPYPYPVAISVNGPVGGMEYPMICFNGPRPKEDGTYSGKAGDGQPWKHSKYGLIGVVIHEVGHNWYPMIVNSDERQWTWMDEGLNSYVQFLAEARWEEDYPSRRGEPRNIVDYMRSANQRPIMTQSEALLQFGNNGYAKPATALNILRETVLGRETMDDAFRQYSQAWAFKRPYPADFFRLMEDASGEDLDWFWRGWFYSTDAVDVSVSKVEHYRVSDRNPTTVAKRKKQERDEEPISRSEQRNQGLERRTDRYPQLVDFYNDYDPLDVTEKQRDAYEELLADLEPQQAALLTSNQVVSVITLENHGGLVTPVPLKLTYEGGKTEEVTLPAELWLRSAKRVRKAFVADKPIVAVHFDPYLETADTETSNNQWPPEPVEHYIELKNPDADEKDNPMQDAGLGKKRKDK